MGAHIIDGEFQSDKYPTCPRGKVPLSIKDPTAQDLLWEYAQRRRAVDAEFSDDLEAALLSKGYDGRIHRTGMPSAEETISTARRYLDSANREVARMAAGVLLMADQLRECVAVCSDTAEHQITFGRTNNRYHTWSCSCGSEGEPAILRRTAKAEAIEHIARPNVCRGCGSGIADGRTVCGALECGRRELP